MMSRPDFVQVDHPGAGATETRGGSGTSELQESGIDTIGGNSIPWTIGSTDRIRVPSGSLVDRLTPPPPPIQHGEDSTVAAPQFSSGAAIDGDTGAAKTTVPTKTKTNTTILTKSLYHDRLINPKSPAVEACLSAACDVMGFDIAEMWLRTGPKTHQLTNSHLRPSALEDSVRKELVDVYYGERSAERTHLLSPALCKRAKEAMDVVWITAHTPAGAETLSSSISDVRTAVAVPVCHMTSNTNITFIYFSIRRNVMRTTAVEYLVHMSLAAAVASVNSLSEDGLIDKPKLSLTGNRIDAADNRRRDSQHLSRSERPPQHLPQIQINRVSERRSITGAPLDLQWRQLHNVEYLTDGGNSWIHTAVLEDKPVVVKTLKPECQDVALAINEIEAELAIHARLSHSNICSLLGAGITSKGVRFVVLERLDGGTMSQMLGYDNRIRDRRRRFWRKKQFSYVDVLRCARSIADAMSYIQEKAIPGSILLHRDLKPDNIGFTLNGQVKIIDFGLARIVENANPMSNDVYELSGETGSLRYMAPEVAKSLPYNHKADVYSLGVILWELNACKKPFEGLDRDRFFEQVVHGGLRPPIAKKWPSELATLITDCWSDDIEKRPTFSEVLVRLDQMLAKEKGGTVTPGEKKSRGSKGVLSGLIDRHSTWF